MTRLYTDKNKDTNGEDTMHKFNANSLYCLQYIFQCKLGTLHTQKKYFRPSTKRQTLEFAVSDLICCERFEFAVGDLNLL